MGAMLFYTLAVVLERHIVAPISVGGAAVPVPLFLACEQLVIALIYLPMLFFFHNGYTSIKHGVETAGPAILLVAVLTVGYRFCGSTALSFAEGQLGPFTAIKRLSALVAVVIGGNLFHEEHLRARITASAIMLLGAAMILI